MRSSFTWTHRISERGFRFIGRSKIIHCSGVTLAEAGAADEVVIHAQLRLDEAREKHVVIKKNEFEVSLFLGRRPKFYGLLSDEA